MTATDTNGTAVSSNAFLFLFLPPAFVLNPVAQTVLQGGTATFTAIATGAPVLVEDGASADPRVTGRAIRSLMVAPLIVGGSPVGVLEVGRRSRRLDPRAFRNSMMASVAPALVFALSIPIAFVDPGLGLASWLLIIPLEFLIGKYLRTDPA